MQSRNQFLNTAKTRPKDAVLLATGIIHEAFGEPITRQLLDRIVADIPFIVGCFDHHTMWANTKALEAAGIMRGRDLPVGNEIVLDGKGIATGELREPAAYMLIQALTPTGGREWLGMTTGENPNPPATAAQRATDIAFFRQGIAYAASLGITSMHNMDGNWYQLELLQEMPGPRRTRCARRDPLPPEELLRAVARRRGSRHARGVQRRHAALPPREDLHRRRAGNIDRADDRRLSGPSRQQGAPLFTAADFDALVTRADRHGFQISTHAIGDGAIRRTLDGYAAAQKANGRRDFAPPHRAYRTDRSGRHSRA